MSPRRLRCLLVLPLAIALVAAKPTTAESVYEPPLMRFQEELSLMEAVRLTLANDPLIRLQGAAVALQEGVAEEASGEFDTVLSSDMSIEYRQAELTESRKRREREKREDLDEIIAEIEGFQNDLDLASDYLSDPTLLTNPSGTGVPAGIEDDQMRTDLEIIQAQLILLNDLLARATDPAIQQDLTNLRDGLLAKHLDRLAQGAEGASEGIDQLRQSRANLGDAPVDEWQLNGRAAVNVRRKLRLGIVLTPYISWEYSAANYVGKSSSDPNFGGMGVEPFHKAELGFDVVLPLQRGLGGGSAAAAERAAEQDLEAARLSYLHQKSRSVLDVTLAYWELRGAQEDLGVLRESVRLQENLLTMTRALAKARQLPGAEVTRSRAALADAKARLEAGDRRLRQAQVALARVMGVALADLEMAPLAADRFPVPAGDVSTATDALAGLVDSALERRYDRQAAAHTRNAADLLARGAELDTRWLVNLGVRVWGNSVSESSPNLDRWLFSSGRAGLEIEVPFGNDRLEGRLAQRRATLDRSAIDVADLERRIALGVLRGAAMLRDTAEQLALAREAVKMYAQTIEDEQARFKLGESTLIDVLVTEQQTTLARQSLVAAAQSYAGLVARLRFEAGLLVEEAEGRSRVSAASLLEVPRKLQKAAAVEEVSP